MRTIRAKELKIGQTILDDNGDKTKIGRVDVTHRGTILLWTGIEGATMRFYNPEDVVVIK